MSIARPVSKETLASIPWMSGKSLSQTMREVSIRGPNDAETWRNLLSRADVIVESLNSKQSALILNSLARVRSSVIDYEPFLKRFMNKFLHHVVSECNGLDVAQLVHGISEFSNLKPKPELIESFHERILFTVSLMEERELCMLALGVSRLFHTTCPKNSALVQAVVKRGLEISETLNDQTLAQLINLGTMMSGEHELLTMGLVPRATALVQSNMSPRSAVLILSSLARSKIKCDEYISGFTQRFSSLSSLRQQIVTLRSFQKMGMMQSDPSLLYSLLDRIKANFSRNGLSQSLDIKTLCVLANAASRISSASQFFEDVMHAIIARDDVTKMSGCEVTSLIQSIARIGTNGNPTILETLLKKHLLVESIEFTGQQLSIIAVTLTRLGKVDLSLFQWFKLKCKHMEDACRISEHELRSIRLSLDRV